MIKNLLKDLTFKHRWKVKANLILLIMKIKWNNHLIQANLNKNKNKNKEAFKDQISFFLLIIPTSSSLIFNILKQKN